MCWSVKANGVWCSSMGELRKALYPYSDCIVIRDGYPDFARNHSSCLCPLNQDATAAKLGMTVRVLDDGDAEFI